MAPSPVVSANKTPDSIKNLIDAGFQKLCIVSFAAKLNVLSTDVLKYTQDTTVSQLVVAATEPPR